MKNLLSRFQFDVLATSIFFALIAIMFVLGDTPANAATNTAIDPAFFSADLISPGDAPNDVIKDTSFRNSLLGVVNYFLGFTGLVAVFFVIYAGALMITAQGEDDQVGKGKKIIQWAAAGIIIILLSYSMVNFVIFAGKNGGS